VENVIFRVAQEAVSNAVKHGKASSVEIQLKATDRRCDLTVVDDGAGFRRKRRPANTPSAMGGLGLGIMEARVRELGGQLRIRSAVGRGTCVSAQFTT